MRNSSVLAIALAFAVSANAAPNQTAQNSKKLAGKRAAASSAAQAPAAATTQAALPVATEAPATAASSTYQYIESEGRTTVTVTPQLIFARIGSKEVTQEADGKNLTLQADHGLANNVSVGAQVELANGTMNNRLDSDKMVFGTQQQQGMSDVTFTGKKLMDTSRSDLKVFAAADLSWSPATRISDTTGRTTSSNNYSGGNALTPKVGTQWRPLQTPYLLGTELSYKFRGDRKGEEITNGNSDAVVNSTTSGGNDTALTAYVEYSKSTSRVYGFAATSTWTDEASILRTSGLASERTDIYPHQLYLLTAYASFQVEQIQVIPSISRQFLNDERHFKYEEYGATRVGLSARMAL